MLGTIVNTVCIIAGTALGSLVQKGIREKYKDALYTALGLVSLAIGLNATIGHLGKSEYPVLFIVSIVVGSVAGTMFDIDGRFNRLIGRIQGTSTGGNEDGARRGGNRLGEGLSLAILFYCIGPLSMLGPVVSALNGDNSFLYTNATLDLVSSTVFASTYGFGMVLAAPVLFCWQGLFYVTATVSSSAISDALMSELLTVGGLLITGSGFSILGIKDCKTLNMLPSLLVPVVWFLAAFLLKG
jgi:uncharacterized membrane protein YqgA involved in biofilm formation